MAKKMGVPGRYFQNLAYWSDHFEKLSPLHPILGKSRQRNRGRTVDQGPRSAVFF